MEFLQSGKSVTSERIISIEKELEIAIPARYRLFLQKHNGGHPEPNRFYLRSDNFNEEISVEYFLGIDLHNRFDLKNIIEFYRNRIPISMFPFATVGGGSLLLIDAEEKVYFWDSEFEYGTDENLFLVSKDFDTFLKSLV